MNVLIENSELLLHYVVQICTLLMEYLGILVLVTTAIGCFIRWLKHDSGIRLDLGQGIALALEFKMGGEVLRTVIVREYSELILLGAIILLRGVLTFLIHWEIKNEKAELENEKLEAERDKRAAE